MAGNMFGAEVETVNYNAGIGLVMLGNGKGFAPLTLQQNKICTPYDTRHVLRITMGTQKQPAILVVNNSGPVLLFMQRPKQAKGAVAMR